MSNTAKIKRLEWEYSPFQGGEEWIAKPIPNFLKYTIVKRNDRGTYSIYLNSEPRKYSDDFNEAQHLAQADFENKISGCLS